MSLAIRLARGGMKKKPYYRIVVTDARNARDGKFLEKIGTYNPLLHKDNADRVKLDTERAAHWLSVGAQPSDRVARFLDAAGVRTRAPRLNPTKAVPGAKAKERTEANAMKAAEAEEAKTAAATAAAEAAAAAAAAPAPEPEPMPEPEPVEAPADTEVAVDASSEAPAEGAVEAVNEAPVEAASVEEAPVQEAPVEEAPVEADAPAGPSVETDPAPDAIDVVTETDASPAGPAV